MKVLSIKEPFATLIKEKKKSIETRSWKTSYRGELYIHASISKVPEKLKEREAIKEVLEEFPLNYGHIICKCNLVDCVYMTKEYVEYMKENSSEYPYGEYKEGRYGWVLEDVVPLEKPIPAKGNLNIWNYYNENEILSLMQNIKYGHLDQNAQITNDYSNYLLSSPQETIKTGIGICWDQVELERYYFQNTGYRVHTYIFIYYNNKDCPTHSFLTYEKNGKYYWFEHAYEKYQGIHCYDTLKELLKDVENKFVKDTIKEDFEPQNLCLYEYSKPQSHLSVSDFFKHCEKNKPLNIESL